LLELNQRFPNEIEEQRIKVQSSWEKMYHSEYIYNKIIDYRGKQVPIDPLVPIPAIISEINADLLFGEFPKFNFQDETINKLINKMIRNKLESDMLELATYVSAVGTVFWKFFMIDNEINYEFIQGNKVAEWEEGLKGITNIKFFEELETDKYNKFTWYIIEEHIYEDDQYFILRYKIKVKNTTNEIVKIEDIEREVTGLDFMPIIKVINIGQMNSKIGKSDYQGKEQLFAEIDNRVDQINYVLQENADPWKFLPPGILDPHGRFNKRDGKMVEKAPGGDNTVDIVTWDASLDAAFRQIEKMIELVFFTCRISSPIAGLEKGGQVESGRALKWRSINTFSNINKKRKYFNKVFYKMFEIISKLDSEYKNIDIDKLIIEWQDGLPLDSREITDNIIRQVQAGILSKLTAIQKINEVDKKEANDELEQIKKEKGDEAELQQRALPITL